MDVIAGNLGFFDEIVRPHIKSKLTFSAIAELREQLCPESSMQASVIGFVQASPEPCLLVEAAMALKKNELVRSNQESLGYLGKRVPMPVLRAVRVTLNDAARRKDLFIPKNMRIPDKSVISQVLAQELIHLEATENLSWWTSGGTSLADQSVEVEVNRVGNRAHALITPTR